MIAKIVKGYSFKGVVDYVLGKEGAELIACEGIRLKDRDSVVQSFLTQAKMNPKLSKSVGHISLDFSAQDKDKLTNERMVEIARNYMDKMGIKDTQYLIGRHHDTDHPHIHIIFNRVDNNGKTISDQNDRFRSEKICKELTNKYGLYFATGKENVKTHRLKEPDKSKYEIYESLKKHVPESKNWQELIKELKKDGISVQFKNKGNTNEIQGIIFSKNGYTFNGSKVDRMFSYSKIDFQLRQNERQSARNEQRQQAQIQSQTQIPSHKTQESGLLENILSAGMGLLDMDIKPQSNEDEEYLNRMRKKKKKKPYRPKF